MEGERHWETYQKGGTCNFGTHNFYVGDVDGDGVMELVTGGYQYNTPDHNYSDVVASLYIWNWNGQNFTLETSRKWPGMIRSIYAGDADGDGSTEIITGGYGSLTIWNWNGEELSAKATYDGLSASSIYISDVGKERIPEIMAVGSHYNGASSVPQLQLLNWDGNSYVTLFTFTSVRANSVCAYDLDSDGVVEIVTGGCYSDVKNSSGQICVWHQNGTELSLEDSAEWRTVEDGYGMDIAANPMGNTMVSNLKVGDVDTDGTPEIVAGGFTYDGEKVEAQLTIWNWSNQTFTMEESYEWSSNDITEVKALAIADVDGDEHLDIVTSGFIGVYGGFSDQNTPPEQAQLRVWSWNGQTLTLKRGEDWSVGEGVTAWNVATGDVDQDGKVEIVTVGCMYESKMCDPDLRIWSIPSESNSLLYPLLAALGVIIVMSVAVFLLLRKK